MNSIFNSFKLQDTLSPEIWNGVKKHDIKDIKIKPEIRQALLAISKDFIDSFKIESLEIEDVLLVGSLANYNWSEYSDVDIHVVIDKSKLGDNIDVIDEFFDAKKELYNLKHNITIKGYEIEIYGQDINEDLKSSGVYSILFNKWGTIPDKEALIFDKKIVIAKVREFIKNLTALEKLEDTEEKLNKIEALKDKIRKYRKSGLSHGGELSNENLVFKYLRRSGFLEKISKLKIGTNDAIMTLKEVTPNDNNL